ncbi:30S ribosomal protein S15 [Auxenochlorella protothecoides]|uniref:30S ribosomal protein S15 n=1 Tax=Auxenochlorella protothecoides TaxID=3075 RepID=A0A087SSB5_AUXPR|nr:30S ribosomal protein S15 [Auxenochlorella protothecoides]KFM28619.1 30S ribosomal protein S15 [Auxenochlorella protothecoides]RMZ55755.1 hypothetical protein APUTEX25_005796 [Auxenochlorella protothecoides]|eukprot:RMZ55755.1 hypothetical protein APUTEX25_005796 [Auxenochlorella protothecoides]
MPTLHMHVCCPVEVFEVGYLSKELTDMAYLAAARYRGKGTDLSRVPAFQRSSTDSGSSEVQIARLTARVAQLTVHLQEHKKDYASRRGLMQVLSRRKQLLLYLQSTDRPKYEHVLQSLGIRAPKSGSI